MIGISIFTVFQFTFSDSLNTRQRTFYEQDFDPNTNKILLIGSSHVGQVNATYIDEFISDKMPNSVVYNLAESSNHPSQRLSSIDEIITLKPSIVVYGIAYRDFSDKSQIHKDAIFPDPEKIFHDSVTSPLLENVDFLENPKLITLNTIRNLMKTNVIDNPSAFYKNNTPFFPYDDLENNMISTNSEIEKNHNKNSIQIKINVINNKEIHSLEKIIKIFQQNNTPLIIFITPHSEFYTDLISDSEKKIISFYYV